MRHLKSILLASLVILIASSGFVAAQTPAQVTATKADTPSTQKDTIAGIRNFRAIDDKFSLGGAVDSSALAALGQRGFRTVINLRAPGEDGANVEAEAAAAQKAGLAYFNIPLPVNVPDPAAADAFLEAIGKADQPVFFHCSAGVRASAVWIIKRVMQDGWSVERARAEATRQGLINEKWTNYALDYLKARGK